MPDQWFYSDGQSQEGPISFDELKALASSGKLNPKSSLVWTEGYEDWVAAGSVEGLFSAGEEIAQATAEGGDSSSSSAFSEEFTIKGCIKEAWRLTKAHLPKVLGIGVVYLLVYFAFAFVSHMAQGALGVEKDADGAVISGLGIFFLFTAFENIFGAFLGLGMTRFYLNLIKSGEAAIGDLFSQGGKLFSAVGAYIIFTLLVMLGLVLFIVPGVIFAVRLVFYQIAIVDKGMGPIDALQYSWDVTRGNTLNLIGLWVVSILIVLAGALAFLIGLIWAAPCATFAYYVAYLMLERKVADSKSES